MIDNVVLLSGGLDSTTALAMAVTGSEGETVAITFNYGSQHAISELEAARKICQFYQVKHQEITLPSGIFAQGQSALMGKQEIPSADYVEAGPQPTVVPFRNGTLISVATAIAESIGAKYVWTANHASDWDAWAYPDCSPQFLGAMSAAIHVATMGTVALKFPFIWMCKGEIVELGWDLHVPFVHTWSCYRGGEFHCGDCPTCRERKQAFHDAGVNDPTEYLK